MDKFSSAPLRFKGIWTISQGDCEHVAVDKKVHASGLEILKVIHFQILMGRLDLLLAGCGQSDGQCKQ